MRNSRNTPETKVDNRVRPPDFTLITVCPIMAQPAMPPKNPVITLEMPCPRISRFLSLPVSVISSTSDAVSSDSVIPTTARAREIGNIVRIMSKLTVTFGMWKNGSACVMLPMSPTVCTGALNQTATIVITMIATSADGTALVTSGNK
ncbi:Uncharacterised protein [Actinobacillus pleuropneumoniae]|nr:Uncharacterised protein [Actinobacillus pleuropneumoniae]